MVGKIKMDFLDGSLPMPSDFELAHMYWLRCNNLVPQWIINSVLPSIAQSLAFKDNTNKAWIDLKEIFF